MITWLLKNLEKNPTSLFRKKELLKKSKKQFEQLKRQGFLIFVQPDPHHETYPCSIACSNTCPMEVVDEDGKLFAICPKDTEVDPFPIEADDLSKYSFSVDKLLEQIHTANELDGSLHRVSSNYSYIGYKTCNDNRVGFVFIPKIADLSMLELSGLNQLCEDDDLLVVLTPASKIEDVSLKGMLRDKKIVQSSLVSSVNLQTFELPIETLISEILKPKTEQSKKAKRLCDTAAALKEWMIAGQNNQENSEKAQLLGMEAMQLITENLELLTVCLDTSGGSLKTKNALNAHLSMIEGMRINNDLSFENMGSYYDYQFFAQGHFISDIETWITSLKNNHKEVPPAEEPQAENVFKKTGDFWTVRFQGKTHTIKNSTGMAYIACLLVKPNKPITALILANPKSDTKLMAQSKVVENDAVSSGSSKQQEIIDKDTLQSCQKRLVDIASELADAEKNNDLAVQKRLREEKEEILSYIQSATKPSGQSGSFNDDVERARKAVFISIKRALDNIKKHNPTLYQHFYNSIQRGTDFVYKPDREINWEL